MRTKLKNIMAAIFVIVLLTLLLTPGSVHSRAVPNPDQTILQVRQPGAQPGWYTSRTIHALHGLSFRWKTDVPMTNYGQWQLCDYPPPPQDLMAQPFAVSDPTQPLPVPPAGQYGTFTL